MSNRLAAYVESVRRLEEALSMPPSPIVRDAAIQRFETCFELAWKCVQHAARDAGLDCRSPKHCFQVAFQQGWLDDEAGWLAILEDRNRTTHAYDDVLADAVFARLGPHAARLRQLADRLARAGR